MSDQAFCEREMFPLAPRPLPEEGMRQNVQCLDGIWEFSHRQKEEWEEWHPTAVPSYIGKHADEREGFTGRYRYRRKLFFLPEWQNRVKLLKFEGVNGYARVSVDGTLVAEHWNGFLTWTVDITEVCCGKQEVTLVVDVDETKDRVGCFYHGGIIHSVYLYLLPETYFSMLQISTKLDENYQNAVLTAEYAVEQGNEDCQIQGSLRDPGGIELWNGTFSETLPKGQTRSRIEKTVTSPLLWDAEHPWLYTLRLSLCQRGRVLETVEKKFGFREIQRRENQVFVNGKEIKLRGVCRHEVSPLHERCLTKELIDEDVRLFKEANCNYIRTSHYSPSEYFLEACDREGMYVEDELGLAFVAKTTPFTQRDPGETERFLSHFQEAFARDGSHPSVLIWSLCNESFGGYNFDLLNRYIHKVDPTRLTKFSYPMTMRLEHEPVDVWSIHYSNQDVDLSAKLDNVSVGKMEGKDVPVIHDEYAHIPCYNREEHRRDPNVRNFWGRSIRRFWDQIWNTRGALGGAIWAGIDETHVSNGADTRLEWGIIDIWRRKKPEFYLVRKAYSPVVIRERAVKREKDGSVTISLENRFCHTDFAETRIVWKVGEKSGSIQGPEIGPGQCGKLKLSMVPKGERLELFFRDAFGKRVDEYCLELCENQDKNLSLEREQEDWRVSEEAENLLFYRKETVLVFRKETGKILEGRIGEERLLTGGPDLVMSGIILGEWKKETMTFSVENGTVHLRLLGWYGEEVQVLFLIDLERDGKIQVSYRIEKLRSSLPDEIKLRVSVSEGGLNELGISLEGAPGMDALSWKREGEWSLYPEDHIGRTEGTAFRFSKGSPFAEQPEIAWKDETNQVILNGKYDVTYRGTRDFCSLKEQIQKASLFRTEGRSQITVVSEGCHSVRAEVGEPEECLIFCEDKRISYTGEWTLMEDLRKGRRYREMWAKNPDCSARLTFTGTGVVWYGPVDVVCGYASVYLDGELADPEILQRVAGVDFPGSADGYDKKYHYPLYSISNLPMGEHTLEIKPLGKGNSESQDTYIVIEKFRILDGSRPEPVRLMILNEYNYPMISWGNYRKPPILISEGYENQAAFYLEKEKKQDGKTI